MIPNDILSNFYQKRADFATQIATAIFQSAHRELSDLQAMDEQAENSSVFSSGQRKKRSLKLMLLYGYYFLPINGRVDHGFVPVQIKGWAEGLAEEIWKILGGTTFQGYDFFALAKELYRGNAGKPEGDYWLPLLSFAALMQNERLDTPLYRALELKVLSSEAGGSFFSKTINVRYKCTLHPFFVDMLQALEKVASTDANIKTEVLQWLPAGPIKPYESHLEAEMFGPNFDKGGKYGTYMFSPTDYSVIYEERVLVMPKKCYPFADWPVEDKRLRKGSVRTQWPGLPEIYRHLLCGDYPFRLLVRFE